MATVPAGPRVLSASSIATSRDATHGYPCSDTGGEVGGAKGRSDVRRPRPSNERRTATVVGLWGVAAAVVGGLVAGGFALYIHADSGGSASGPSSARPPTSQPASHAIVPPGFGKADFRPCVKVHVDTTLASHSFACIPLNNIVRLTCTEYGQSVRGEFNTTRLWDRLSYKGKTGYVPDAYMYTGSNSAVVSSC